jgi:hypothetical protein
MIGLESLPCSYGLAHTIYLDALGSWRESLGHCHRYWGFATLLGQLTCVTTTMGGRGGGSSFLDLSLMGNRSWV